MSLLGERNSATKSGQTWENFSRSDRGIRSHRSRVIQDASGPRIAELGRVKPAEESNAMPKPLFLFQFHNCAPRVKLRWLPSGPAGGMTINSPWAERSSRRSGFT